MKKIYVEDPVTSEKREFNPKTDRIEDFVGWTIKQTMTKDEVEKIYGKTVGTNGTA